MSGAGSPKNGGKRRRNRNKNKSKDAPESPKVQGGKAPAAAAGKGGKAPVASSQSPVSSPRNKRSGSKDRRNKKRLERSTSSTSSSGSVGSAGVKVKLVSFPVAQDVTDAVTRALKASPNLVVFTGVADETVFAALNEAVQASNAKLSGVYNADSTSDVAIFFDGSVFKESKDGKAAALSKKDQKRFRELSNRVGYVTLAAGSAVLHVYGVSLDAAFTAKGAQRREADALLLAKKFALETEKDGQHVIAAGSFNTYQPSESAYKALLSSVRDAADAKRSFGKALSFPAKLATSSARNQEIDTRSNFVFADKRVGAENYAVADGGVSVSLNC